jgi:xanthine dehydrogenase accessory factor
MKDLLSEKACELLADNTGFVIATIIGHEGSTPRTSGTKMIITGDGKCTGTIGGGMLETRVTEKAVKIINGQGISTFMPFDLTYDDVDSMDMICGGRAEIFLDHILPAAETADVFTRWNRVTQKREGAFFITTVLGESGHIERVCHAVVNQDRIWDDTFPLPIEALEKIGRQTRKTPSLSVLKLENGLVIIEPAFKAKTAFLCGAGHVAKPTAHLCTLTGFYVTVLDDRGEFANADNFPDAHEIHVLASFEDTFADNHIEADAFIVIFTRGHLHDRTVLARALKTRAGYIGMIGSRRKRDAIFKALLNAGYDQKDIDRVHSPIGLAIGAQSPEEIAVSIVAQMIQERAQMSV